MTYEWKHPSYYKELAKLRKESEQEEQTNEDRKEDKDERE
mgnify:CR=1 FL=1|jgi:hypothetical protein|tara:strand:+ start:205 stop:324 length:120 start_codon:yes stop_codon:yes gene_type:complete